MSYYIGIDPGNSGAIAVIHPKGISTCRLEHGPYELVNFLEQWNATHCFAYIEKAGSQPGNAPRAMFTFGTSYGICLGVIAALGIPIDKVAAGVWQRNLGCLTGGDKNISKRKAQELFPEHPRITHKEADAMLIAEFCRRKRTGDA